MVGLLPEKIVWDKRLISYSMSKDQSDALNPEMGV